MYCECIYIVHRFFLFLSLNRLSTDTLVHVQQQLIGVDFGKRNRNKSSFLSILRSFSCGPSVYCLFKTKSKVLFSFTFSLCLQLFLSISLPRPLYFSCPLIHLHSISIVHKRESSIALDCVILWISAFRRVSLHDIELHFIDHGPSQSPVGSFLARPSLYKNTFLTF